jgi:hypothetical protein
MNGTIGHLRNVADLVAALNIEAILAEAGLASHESATDLALEVEEGDAPSFTTRQVHELADEAARAGDRETVEACEAYLENPEAGWAADIIDEALSYARAMQ